MIWKTVNQLEKQVKALSDTVKELEFINECQNEKIERLCKASVYGVPLGYVEVIEEVLQKRSQEWEADDLPWDGEENEEV